MVKIKFKLVVMVIIAFLLVGIANAASNITFSDVDVKVGGKSSKNLENGETIDDEASPGDTVEFKVEVKNNFTSSQNIDIEDITVEVTIEEIDDGEDMEEESIDFDLSAGRDKSVTLRFEVPLEVEEDSFDVLIRAEGEDENGVEHTAEMRLTLDVDKETHQLIFTRKTLAPDTVSCARKNIRLDSTVVNIGNEDEEDIVLQVNSPDLNVDLKENVAELEAEANEDTSKYSKTFLFNVPQNAEAGSYPVILTATYNDGRKKTQDTLTLNVNECTLQQPPKQENRNDGGVVDVIMPPAEKQQQVPPGTFASTESFFRSNAFIMLLISGAVFAIIALAILLVIVLVVSRS